MAHIKKYSRFVEEYIAGPEVKPATPTTKPGTRPGRPSPIRRDKPSVTPKPKAEETELPYATADEGAKKFIDLLDDKGEDVKKYVK